jgi:signal transduction histidine kinase/CheY-like chemotaxis protein
VPEFFQQPDFELRSVVQANRLPILPMTFISALHVIVLVYLGHAWLAAGWIAVMAPIDLWAHARASALLKSRLLDERYVESRLALASACRFLIIMAGPALACLQRPGSGELMFLMLTFAAVCSGGAVIAGHRVRLLLACFGPALLGLALGLWSFPWVQNVEAIAVALLVNVLLMAGMVRGTMQFSKIRRQLAVERRAAVKALIEARHRQEEELDAKSVFLSILSHEVRTPLNGVMGLAEVLAKSDLSPRQAEHLAAIRASGVLMRTILDDVLDASKIEAGRMELSLAPVRLKDLFEQVGHVWGPPAQLKGVAFERHIDIDDGDYAIDAVRLQQIVNNLLSNAVKFTSAGMVSLKAWLVDAPGETTRRLRVEVADTGVGMTDKAADKLFGRFVQADAGVAGRFGGTGVGLYVSKNLIELMRGRIGVISEVGKGSIFWFEIDIEPVTSEARDQPEATLPTRLRILAVDDNPTNRRVIALLLEMLGQDCELAESGAAALDRLRVETFDLVLMDLRMPGMSGEDALHALRSEATPNRRTPVLALTADATDWTEATARARGFDGFVCKPVELVKLAGAITAVEVAGKSILGRVDEVDSQIS